jgi:VIT1/CCC1 family predicted Fe2+/Mn2+ transporter
MATEETSQRASANPSAPLSPPPVSWGRPLALTAALVFCISSVFPMVAAFVRDTADWPEWWGVLDVVIAFVLAALALAVLGLGQGKVNKPAEEHSYRAYRLLLHGIFVMLVVFVFFGDRIVWSNCLTGLAWRAWLLLYSLPAWLTLVRASADAAGPEAMR